MQIVSNLIRAAALAVFAIAASALAPSTGGEAQAQSGWSGHRAQHHRVAPRPAYRHRHVAPRRAYHRPVVRHYGPRYRPAYASHRRCVIQSRWVNTYYGPRLIKQRVCHRRW